MFWLIVSNFTAKEAGLFHDVSTSSIILVSEKKSRSNSSERL